jgi:hypothetical protein
VGYRLAARVGIIYQEGSTGAGSFSEATSAIQLFDVATNAWYVLGNSPLRRLRIASAVTPEGMLLAISGLERAATTAATLYNPLNNTITTIAPLPAARVNAAAGTLRDGRVFVLGGFTATSLAAAEVYVYARGAWSLSPARLLTARSRLTATVLTDGRILVVGGTLSNRTVSAAAEIADASLTRFAAVPDLPSPRAAAAAARLANGNVLVAGGSILLDGVDYAINLVHIFDVRLNVWTAAAALRFARWGASAVALSRGDVIVVGGFDSARPVAEVEIYNAALNAWALLAPMAAPRFFGAIGLVNIAFAACSNTSGQLAWTPPPACLGVSVCLLSCCVWAGG